MSFFGGWFIPILVIGVGSVTGFVVYSKFASGELSIGSEPLRVEIAEKEGVIKDLERELAIAQERLAEREKLLKYTEVYVPLQAELKEQRAVNAAIRSRLLSLSEGFEETTEMLDSYKKRYRGHIRAKAVGTKMAELTTLSGKTYSQVQIKSIGALGMNITHRDGSGRIPFKDLPRHMQRLYQFDEEEAEAQQKREGERRRKHELAQVAALRAAENNDSEEIKVDPAIAKREAEERERAIEKLKSAIQSIDSRISRAESNLSAEKRKAISRAPQYRTELEHLRKAKKENESRLNALRAIR